MAGNFDVDESKFDYLKPIWSILENNPEGISLDALVEQSGLDKTKMLKTIELLSIEYNQVTRKFLTRGNIFSMVKSALEGKKPDESLKNDLASSWIFDKVMLYARCKELDWTDQVWDKEIFEDMKKTWLETKGM